MKGDGVGGGLGSPAVIVSVNCGGLLAGDSAGIGVIRVSGPVGSDMAPGSMEKLID